MNTPQETHTIPWQPAFTLQPLRQETGYSGISVSSLVDGIALCTWDAGRMLVSYLEPWDRSGMRTEAQWEPMGWRPPWEMFSSCTRETMSLLPDLFLTESPVSLTELVLKVRYLLYVYVVTTCNKKICAHSVTSVVSNSLKSCRL